MLPCLLLSLFTTAAANTTGFIVGGHFASIDKWPFIASVIAFRDNDSFILCGGSLISSQTVLTAAHCLDDVTDKKYMDYTFTILMGHERFSNAILKRDPYDYQTHESYDPNDVQFDIGVIFLQAPVVFIPTVKKVLMVNQRIARKLGSIGGLAVAGWGRSGLENPFGEKLQYMNQTLIDWNRCQDANMDPGIVCAEDGTSNGYAYSADSGGPLARVEDQFLVGLVSYKPMYSDGLTVYTSVAYYYHWIEKTQRQLFAKYCPRIVFKDLT